MTYKSAQRLDLFIAHYFANAPKEDAMRKQLNLVLTVTVALALTGSVISFAAPPGPNLGEELFKLTASDAARFHVFGRSVGISGESGIVGAPGAGEDGRSPGTAYLFDTTTGDELFRLTSSDGAAEDQFGNSVSISGNRAIVGAYGKNAATGSAYLFDVTTGQELLRLAASDAAAGNAFGGSVAISGNMAIVGAYAHENYSGSAYVFDVNTGQELFKLTASDPAPGEFFGYSVAISGNVAIVGSLADVIEGGVVNSAYLFDVTTGQQLRKLSPSDSAAIDFGAAVGISGDIAIVGSPQGGTPPGAAYLFDVATGQELFKLTASDAGDYDLFGGAVAISGNTVIVGAEYDHNEGDSIKFGSAYLFDVTTGKQLARLTPSETAEDAAFGASVAFDGKLAIIGAPESVGFTGAAYIVYAVPEPSSLAMAASGAIAIVVCRVRRITTSLCL
jgi:outer membrane protein assembly factor BamB